MSRKLSEKTKSKEHRGEGIGADYIPWIKAAEFNSQGTASNIVDWKHGRTIELLSQGEKWLYLILRWNDKVIDIREQYPLDIEDTNRIADELGARRVGNGLVHMTTDLLVTLDDGTYRAYSVKPDERSIGVRTREKLAIEKKYWEERGIQWRNILKSDLSRTYAKNIEDVVRFYSIPDDPDPINRIKHMIARKEVIVDMKSEPLNYASLVNKYLTKGA
jgi:hypothetical protein